MQSKAGSGSAGTDRYARATALLRALTGVRDARIDAGAGGIRAIVITADPGASAWEVTRNVQSALLASLGLAVERSAVRVVQPAPETPTPAQPVPGAPVPAPPLGLAGSGNGNGHGIANGTSNGSGSAPNPMTVVAPAVPVAAMAAGRTVLVGSAGAHGGSIARLDLEARPEGRIASRVVVALPDRIAAGEAEGEDTPRGRAETAARAVIAAAPAVGAELEGIRVVDVSGRYYVMVAVRSWSGRELVYRAGVAPQEASTEAAAARAALDALLS